MKVVPPAAASTNPSSPATASKAPPASTDAPPREPWGWNRRQRIALGFLLALLLIFLTVQLVRRPYRLDDTAVVIDGQPITLPDRIDPNIASVHDLSLIPHIGDALAQKIVDYRDARRSVTADGIVFHQPADLDAVPRIGKSLIEQITPYLRFPDDAKSIK